MRGKTNRCGNDASLGKLSRVSHIPTAITSNTFKLKRTFLNWLDREILIKNKILIGWWVGIDKNCQT